LCNSRCAPETSVREGHPRPPPVRAVAPLALYALKAAGRRDLLGLLADGRLSLPNLHDQYAKSPALLEQRLAQLESPTLGPLVTDWLAWLERPEALSPKTRAPYSRNTIRRYRVSWESIFKAAPEGRAVTLKSLTRGFFLDLLAARFKAGPVAWR